MTTQRQIPQSKWRGDEAVKKSQIRFRYAVVDSSCPTENRQQRTDAARAVIESEAKAKSQSREFRRRARYFQSGHQSLEHRPSPVRESRASLSRLDQAAMEMKAEAEHMKLSQSLQSESEGDQRSKINLSRGKRQDRHSLEQHSSVQDPGAQAQMKQKCTRD